MLANDRLQIYQLPVYVFFLLVFGRDYGGFLVQCPNAGTFDLDKLQLFCWAFDIAFPDCLAPSLHELDGIFWLTTTKAAGADAVDRGPSFVVLSSTEYGDKTCL